MSVFDVNFDRLVLQLLPVRLRQAVQIAWLRCLVSPVKYVYGLFYTNRTNNLYWLGHTGQVCRLEGALNDLFDNVSRRIYISDPTYTDPVYVYLQDELKPVYVYLQSENKPVYVYLQSETYEGAGVTFVVNVPTALGLSAGQVVQLKALVDKYRLPGMVYAIAYFS